jgi:hypothetical protein
MIQKPAVFISSTSDLRSARDLVAKVLHSMGYEPVWQDVEPTDGGELLDVLRQRMAPCGLMIQLVGRRYGAEPPADLRPADFGRVSFTQYEALYFEKLGRKVIYHFLEPGFPTDPAAPEPPELADLQAAYRARIEKGNRLHQANIAGPQDLELSVRRISDELAAFRRQADARYRRMMVFAGGAVAGVVVVAALVAGGIHLLRGGQVDQAAKIDQQTATVERQTAKVDQQTAKADEQAQQLARIEKLLVAQKQANPQAEPTLSAADQALLEQARKQGSLKTRAAASVLKPDADTDALLTELQAKQDAEAFDLAMLQGKRWYFDKLLQEDKAVPFFERAIVLRPDSFEAQSYAAKSRTIARLGDITRHRRRAIEICENTLRRVPAGSADWAATQHNLGLAWSELPTGDRAGNLTQAIAAYQAALTVRTRVAAPADWAATQNRLGNAWGNLPTGDRAGNLAKAIAAYEAVLTVRTRDAAPADWAMTQNNLGTAWAEMPTGDQARNLSKAIAAYEAALEVYTRAAAPAHWATTQNDLGNAWSKLPSGDRAANVTKAVAAYEAALTVHTREAAPADWAMTRNNLGNAWRTLPTGDRAENLAKAIAAYEAALTVHTRDAAPADWAMTQNNLAMALADLAEQPGEDRCARLRQAIACGKAALLVRTPEAFPREHKDTAKNLGIDRKAYEAADCAAKVPFDDIPPAK